MDMDLLGADISQATTSSLLVETGQSEPLDIFASVLGTYEWNPFRELSIPDLPFIVSHHALRNAIPPRTLIRTRILSVAVTSVRLTREERQLVSIIDGFGSRVILRKSVWNGHFLEEGQRKDLEQSVEGSVEVQALLHDGD